MPTPNPTLRREYKGAAAATTLQNPMTNADLSFVLVAANNWPTGSVGKFIVTINRGLADEEKILCDSQTTRTVACLLANRGFDGTTAQSHAAGATVECTISAFDADEWNQHTNATTGVHGVAGAVVGTTDVQSLTGKTLDAASTLGGVSGTSLAADRAAWTVYTPTLTNLTSGNGTVTAAYRQVGKTVNYRITIVTGTTSTSNGSAITVSLPAASVSVQQFGVARGFWGTGSVAGIGQVSGSPATIQVLLPTSTANGALTPWAGPIAGTAFTSGMQVDLHGTYEAA